MKVSDYPIQNGRIDKWIIEAFSLLNSSYQDDIKAKTLFSRTKIKDLILSGNISIDGMINKNPSYKIDPNNTINNVTIIGLKNWPETPGIKNIGTNIDKVVPIEIVTGQNILFVENL